MDYKLFNAEDFAADESFISYYLNKEEKDVAAWTEWIRLHPEKLDEVLNAEELLAALYLQLPAEEVELAMDRFDDFLNATPAVSLEREVPISRMFILKNLAAAACIGLVLFLGGLYFYKRLTAELPVAYVSLHNTYGKMSILWLSDGTKVSLNANSTLKYPKHFSADKREVSLEGEAFFEVAHDKSRPFSVRAGSTKTTVLGTKFNVSAYNTQKNVAVALVEGRVAFEAGNRNQQLILKPAEMAAYDGKTAKISRQLFNPAEVTAWTTGMMVFNHASFADISTKFQNIYGITLKDNTLSQRWNYSGSFSKADYLTVIRSICFAKNLNFKQVKHTIILTNK